MSTLQEHTVNGVDVEQLGQTIEAIQDNADLAHFQFRAHSEWEGGGHSRTWIQGFHGAGKEDTSRAEPFVLEGDEPPVLLGQNQAPNAVETVLHALASCLAVGFVYNAAARGVAVESLDLDLEGELDLRAFLGLSEEVRPGFREIRVTYRSRTDAPREEVEELCEHVQKTSPVLDMLRNPVPVKVRMDA
jgi:uncharacterized OsmC-like protein